MQELVLGHTLTGLRVQPRNTPGITWTEYHPFSLPARPRNPRICSSPQAGFGERPPPYPSSWQSRSPSNRCAVVCLAEFWRGISRQ
ncbi:uncharacterized protein CCOS01_11010 [Colletotrichum costaricense]|uniref:Uncharacterized protein n=2 Tax=Colletotrichum acutatum species complex TaxID=2707335 RepID=A0AAI9YPV6_9PEZI|nr:uncharacterized protein CCOS01_11010 [Colletotrichum costaricense]XP_060379507.1 uncharacterized protein CTAM01_09805 [Colletotrichum tamarilloi]KAK1492607.1 hypothetical protein CTAM01_09805 [Colletotrichum tamarilloi]KAK1519359.1 hypothetical protein CCOS01_11010 [Colletotrichum costaricense]